MLNFGTTKLNQILIMGQSNKNGPEYIGVTSVVATTSKTVFVKVAPTPSNHYVSGRFRDSVIGNVPKLGRVMLVGGLLLIEC